MRVNKRTLSELERHLNTVDTLLRLTYDGASHGEWDIVLSDLERISRAVASATEMAVSAARQDGATWEAIGSALGMTRQSAWERWGGSS